MSKRELGAVCLTLAVVYVGMQAQQRRTVKALDAMDYIEIQQLYARYTQAIDFAGWTDGGLMYASTFTRDGEFVAGPRSDCKGYDKLVACGKQFTQTANPPWMHFVPPPLITPTAEGAIGTAYLVTMRATGPGKNPYPSVAATYTDTLVKTPEGWRFKLRIYRDRTEPGFVVPPRAQ